MKKLLCILFSCILAFNSVFVVHADISGSFDPFVRYKEQHPERFDEYGHVKPAGSELFNRMIVPDLIPGGMDTVDKLAALTGAIGEFLNGFDNSNDDITIEYDNKGEPVTENNYNEKNFYINYSPKFITQLNQKVQDSVHAMDGYYLIEPKGKSPQQYADDNDFSTTDRKKMTDYIKNCSTFLYLRDYYYTCPSNIYYYIVNETYPSSGYSLHAYDKNHNSWDCKRYAMCLNAVSQFQTSQVSPPFIWSPSLDSLIIELSAGKYTYGLPFKVFYSKESLQNYFANSEKRTYAPKLPSGGLKVPITYIQNNVNLPDLNINLDSLIGKAEADIQADIDLALKNYFDKLLELNNNPSQPTNPTPTPSHGGSGGDFGDGTTPTPKPDFGDGSDLTDTNDWLKKIYEWLQSFGDTHSKFEKTITDYIESNGGKLDQIIEAINALSGGKTEDEKNGCKYDFTALSDFMTKLWNESDKKFDKMVELLEENNKYQKKLVNSLNEIKAILVTQTIMDVFQDRSQQTAEKAKDKFPTSLPWDIALVVNAMSAEPEKPQFNLPIQIKSLNINEEIHVDLASGEWEKLAKTCRHLLSILFILLMIQLSRKLFSNGGDD